MGDENKKMKHVYFCSEEIAKQLKAPGTKSYKSHYIYINKNQTTYWPKQVTKENINPDTFFKLTQKYKIKELTIVDRVKINSEKTFINEHINRTGKNFLIGNTPHKNKATFPDASSVYSNTRGSTVVSYGKSYNEVSSKNNKHIISEWIAPISIVWNYIGVKIVGVGVSKTLERIEKE